MPSRQLIRRAAISAGAVLALSGTFVLGVVAGAGSTPDHDSPPPAGVLDDAADQIAGSSLLPVDRDALDAAAIKAMLATAGDQWGSWAEGDGTNGSYAGVGIWLRGTGASLVISQVAADSPARRAGVQVGDELTQVDGRSTDGLTPADVASALRGNPGTTVRLALLHGTRPRVLELTRAEVPALEVTVSMISSTVGRIVVPSFTRGTGRQVRDGLGALLKQRAQGVVLDLRGDPGGLLTEAVETASAFLDGGPIVTYTRRGGSPVHLDAEGEGNTRVPLVVLVDGGTASAAEVVTGALQDRGRAVVVGSRTFGKGTVQEPKHLSDGSSLALTVARYTLPSGRSVDGVGIEPDIQVVSSDGREALSRAREVLAGLQADTGGRG
ncbi:MAG: carboxyl-terminal protease [Frankiales bacterium]|nr:carboxyl-terminal protease [Frankiales bacterium]